MSQRVVGTRVYAIESADDVEVCLLGFGVFEGNFQPPPDVMEPIPGYTNPRIRLDDGRVVWGLQCWWGPEERFESMCAGRVVTPTTLSTEQPPIEPATTP